MKGTGASAVIFDYNGTMVYDEHLHTQAWKEYLSKQAGRAVTEEEDAFSAMLPQNFQILDPGACIVDALYSLLREENLFTHRIHRPSVRFFVTEESLEGGLQKVPLSAQYVQSEYVPHIN